MEESPQRVLVRASAALQASLEGMAEAWEAQALRLVISEAWRQWAALEGVELGSLPVQGLMFEEAA